MSESTAPPPPRKKSRGGLLLLILFVLLPMALCVPLCLIAMPSGVEDGTVLELNLEEPLDEVGGSGPLPFLPGDGRTLLDALLALERGARDPKVVALVAHVGGGGQGPATVQELRDAITRFRGSGKPAIAIAETFGEMTPGVGGYTLATAFDEIWLQPSGEVGLTRLYGEAMFLRGALDKAGVVPELYGRKEFKNAVNQLTERDFTPAHREATVSMLQSLEDQIVDDIAAARPKLGGRDGVRALLSRGLLSAQAALEHGLIDHLGYRDEALAALEKRLGHPPKLLWLHRYAARAELPTQKGFGPAIALITAKGPVVRGENGVDPLSGNASFGSSTTSAAIRAAAKDPDVKAILLRVDSPGGSYVASDTIWRAVQVAKLSGKPFIVSMGDLAASGGYFVSMGADKIVATPGTLTGSIGVYSGKLVTAELWQKLGVNFDVAAAGEGVDPSFFSTDMPYSAAARAMLEAELDRIYADFVNKAAEGRKMSVEQLEPLAHGRVWTGAQAKERGLVDELGGFLRALQVAKESMSLEPTAEVRIKPFPKKRPPLEELLAALRGDEGENSDDIGSNVALRAPAGLAHARDRLARISAALDATILTADLPRLP